MIQNRIKNALEVWLKKVNDNSFTKNDNRWVPHLEDFQLDGNPCIQGRFLLWGWGRKSGHSPQNYSWVIYDPKYPDRFQLSWKRGNYTSTRDISLVTHEDIDYRFDEFDEPIDSLIRPDFWPEDCTKTTDIEEQLEKAYIEILNQLLLGKDIQLSFQKSKNKLHVKTVETKKII
ncbi:MAG: hypothetical protein GXZ11_00725 [Tissierellia bacterium]|nr:hypothetical protein [Tissierellia bacterium]